MTAPVIDPRDPDALIEAACKTFEGINAINKVIEASGKDISAEGLQVLHASLALMFQAATAEATLAVAMLLRGDHDVRRATVDDRK